MLLLDNFVHSDLHPGNIMIKFSKPPTTRILLQNLYNHFFPSRTDSSESDVHHSIMIPADYSQSDAIVSKLRGVADSISDWFVCWPLLKTAVRLRKGGLPTRYPPPREPLLYPPPRGVAPSEETRLGSVLSWAELVAWGVLGVGLTPAIWFLWRSILPVEEMINGCCPLYKLNSSNSPRSESILRCISWSSAVNILG